MAHQIYFFSPHCLKKRFIIIGVGVKEMIELFLRSEGMKKPRLASMCSLNLFYLISLIFI